MSAPRQSGAPPADVASAFELLTEALAAEVGWLGEASREAVTRVDVAHAGWLHERFKVIASLSEEVKTLRQRYPAGPAGAPASSCTPSPPLRHPPTLGGAQARAGGTNSEVVRTLEEVGYVEHSECAATGGKPLSVTLPDGEHAVKHWNDVPVVVARWLSETRGIPIPFAGRDSGKQWLVNTQPFHPNGAPFTADAKRRVTTARQDFWIDTHRSAWDLLRGVAMLVEACGEAPASVLIRFQPNRQHPRR